MAHIQPRSSKMPLNDQLSDERFEKYEKSDENEEDNRRVVTEGVTLTTKELVGHDSRTDCGHVLAKPPSFRNLSLKIDENHSVLPRELSFATMAALAETRHFDSDDSSETDTESELESEDQGCNKDGDQKRLKSFKKAVDAEYVTVVAPPGPLGLKLDDSVPNRAVVMGFVKLRDGSRGPLERHGNVAPGAVIVSINGEDVSRATLMEVRIKLGKLDHLQRTLVFQLPAKKQQGDFSVSNSPAMRPPAPTVCSFQESLDRRRKFELALVMRYDKSVLNRQECWFCIDVKWMTRWVDFVARGIGPEPGPITNETLLHPNWRKMLAHDAPGRPDTPRDGLVLLKDYRVVSPMVWCLLAELHGAGEAPLLARYLVDIYAGAISEREVSKILGVPRLKATVLANDLRAKCLVGRFN